MEDQKQQYLDEMKCLINSEYRDEIKIAELKETFNGMSIEVNKREKLQQLEQWANLSTNPSKRFNSFCYDDDDAEDYTIAVVTPPKWVAAEYGVRGVLLHRSTSIRYIRTTLREFIQTDTLD
uniref:Uncharacterized protein n=1 Tax=Tanacetum cinerariifolium TaxID=118510 RepID=A0A699Q0X6_TANCI|nr:hypothetical protein [Tanacetum cinerariifolium]